MLASDIISRAQIVLNDVGGVRWADSELLKWISDGQRVITLVRPDASSSNTTVTLVAGTKQSLPADGIRLLDVIRNIKANGDPDRAVRLVEREILDAQNPNWHTVAGSVVLNWMVDNRDPLNYYVYPKAGAGQKLEILYSKNPADVTTTGQALSVPDIYAEPLFNYVLFRAYSKDAEFSANAGLAQSYFQVFSSLLGIKTSKDFAFSPDANKLGGIPNPNAVKAGGV